MLEQALHSKKWRRGAVVIASAQLHLTKPELMFCADSNPAHGVSKIRNGIHLGTILHHPQLFKKLNMSDLAYLKQIFFFSLFALR